ncbi:hypothetical protein BDV93DRAFT_563505 [Ceratobasidium sp. AG-I]|nr:hypothetical protein BDV93DRAFT_563505 [Ceratobasidium sp. AG-I]
MSTSGFAKVTGTTSMTNFDRREVKKKRKQLRNKKNSPSGIIPANVDSTNVTQAVPPGGPPRRTGLRGKKYAFYPDRAPVPVVPHKDITIPRRNNAVGQADSSQGGNPSLESDSDCDLHESSRQTHHPGPRITIVSQPRASLLVAQSAIQVPSFYDNPAADPESKTDIEDDESDSDSDDSDSDEDFNHAMGSTMQILVRPEAPAICSDAPVSLASRQAGYNATPHINSPHGVSLALPNEPALHIPEPEASIPAFSFDTSPAHAFGPWQPSNGPHYLPDLSQEDIAILTRSFPDGSVEAANDFGFSFNGITNIPAFSSDTLVPLLQEEGFTAINWTDGGAGIGITTSASSIVTPGQGPFATTLASPSTPIFAPTPIPAPTSPCTSSGLSFFSDTNSGRGVHTPNLLPPTCTVHATTIPRPQTPAPGSRAETPLQAVGHQRNVLTPAHIARSASVPRLQTPAPSLRVGTPLQSPVGYQPYPHPGSIGRPHARPSIRSVSSPLRTSLSRGAATLMSPFASTPSTPTRNARRHSALQTLHVANELDQPAVSHPGTSAVNHSETPAAGRASTTPSNANVNPQITPTTHHAPGHDTGDMGSRDWGLDTWDEDNTMETENVVRQSVPPSQSPIEQIEAPVEAAEDSNGSLLGVNDAPHSTIPARVLRSSNPKAPTQLEIEMYVTEECQRLRDCRKCNDDPSATTAKGIPTVGSFSERDQSFMSLMKAHLFWDYIHRSPWSESNNNLIKRAREYTSKLTNWPGDEIVDTKFRTTFLDSFSQVRSSLQPDMRDFVRHEMKLRIGDEAEIDKLLNCGRFLYPDDQMRPCDMFNIPLLGRAIAKLLFATTRRVGILFIDKLLKPDDGTELETLLTLAALPSDGDELPVIKDRSPEAKCGPSLALIAFACISINHALERLKQPNRRIAFSDTQFNGLWYYYVRELIKHPNLGQLRSSFLGDIKEAYISHCPRRAAPMGNDRAW